MAHEPARSRTVSYAEMIRNIRASTPTSDALTASTEY